MLGSLASDYSEFKYMMEVMEIFSRIKQRFKSNEEKKDPVESHDHIDH